MAAGLLYRLMDLQHHKSHGLTDVRVRLSGLFLPFTCPWFGWALGAVAVPGLLALGRWLVEPLAGCSGQRPAHLEFNTNPASAYWELAWPRAGLYMGSMGACAHSNAEETVVSVVWKPRENSQKSQVLIFPATEEHPD